MRAHDHGLRDALAIAIVQQKRKQDGQLREMAAKIARMEAELLKERGTSSELRAAAVRLVASQQQQQVATEAAADKQQQQQQQGRRQSQRQLERRTRARGAGDGSNEVPAQPVGAGGGPPPGGEEAALCTWLPPLPAQHVVRETPGLGGSMAGCPSASVNGAAAAQPAGLSSKAATLSSMLLANIRLLRLLRGDESPSTVGDGSSDVGGLASAKADQQALSAAGEAAEVVEFVGSTLLSTPATTLSAAYHRSCAARLAALLISEGASGGMVLSGSQQGERAAAVTGSVLGAVSQLAGQLLEAAMPTSEGSSSSDTAATAAVQARCALAALAALPATGAVLLHGCVLHLNRICNALSKGQGDLRAWAGSGGIELYTADINDAAEAAALAAMARGAALLESVHELLALWEDLCTCSLPAWAPELATSAPALLPPLLSQAADAAAAAHTQLPPLASAYPLLAAAFCDALGRFAAALQHVASAPGTCIGPGGPALRAAAARACVQLRDTFMPL